MQEKYNYKLIYCKRKSISIQIDHNAELTVRVPRNTPQSQINKVISEKSKWIDKVLANAKEKKTLIDRHKLTEEEKKTYKRLARKELNKKLEYWAKKLDLKYNKMRLTSGRKTLGSCTSKKNINLSWRLMLLEPKQIDYIVVHELCHLIELNHSKRFWSKVAKVMPDYKKTRKDIKDTNWVFHI